METKINKNPGINYRCTNKYRWMGNKFGDNWAEQLRPDRTICREIFTYILGFS